MSSLVFYENIFFGFVTFLTGIYLIFFNQKFLDKALVRTSKSIEKKRLKEAKVLILIIGIFFFTIGLYIIIFPNLNS